MSPLLEMNGLCLASGALPLVHGVSLSVAQGECLALVGESGSGKSLTALSILRLLPEPEVRITAGTIHLAGVDVAAGTADAACNLRGRVAGMVFQDPQSALHPCVPVGQAVAAIVRHHLQCSNAAARQRALELLKEVSIDDPARRAQQWPHQLSGGLRQRVALAMALAGNPQLLIADEPTTALDVTVQAQLLGLIAHLQRERGLAVLLISHDFGVVAAAADRVAVMQAGRIVETGSVATVLAAPQHVYTQTLLAAVPRLDAAPRSTERAQLASARSTVLVRTENLSVAFNGAAPVLQGVDLEIRTGEALLIVGESGSGKSTLLRALLALERPATGRVLWHRGEAGTQDPWALPPAALRRERAHMGMVFQDSLAAFDPRLPLRASVELPLRASGQAVDRARVDALAREVGLEPALLERFPRQLSGGQRQRVAIARALITEPSLLLLDEAVAALDVSLRAQVLTLLLELRARRSLTLVFVTHDLAVARMLADRILVMQRGRVVEAAQADVFFSGPQQPYSAELLRAVLPPDPVRARAVIAAAAL